ncbi:MAG: exodeoxyribonuclease VII small subunit [Eubacterium sp.]|nr:exodeoxyribonuclease VII small subunit [Eubacterium sp.]
MESDIKKQTPTEENNTSSSGDTKKELTLEESFQKLDALIAKLEDREIPLEESFSLYKQGMDLLKSSREKIDTVEKKMLQINEAGELSEF